MPEIKRDLVIPKELLMEFKGSVRVIDRLRWRGIWPVDARVRQRIEEYMTHLRKSELLLNKYDLVLVYKGKENVISNKYLGLDDMEVKIVKWPLQGIPVPWKLLRDFVDKAKINPLQYELIYTPKAMH